MSFLFKYFNNNNLHFISFDFTSKTNERKKERGKCFFFIFYGYGTNSLMYLCISYR